MGGIHPTAVPEEALLHGDAVVAGEAEGLWEQVVADAREGRLQRLYRHSAFPDFRTPPRPRRAIFPDKGYVPVQTVQASRGCPFTCEFCSVTPFFGRQARLRDPEDVAAEIATFRKHPRWVMFVDDNVLGYGERSRALFRAIQPLRVTWFGQASLLGMQDDATLKLMADSGCRAVFVGFESVSRETLLACGKRQHRETRPGERHQLLLRAGEERAHRSGDAPQHDLADKQERLPIARERLPQLEHVGVIECGHEPGEGERIGRRR
jgi:radical SAM superfamily enzyme YgiQ (UPF0313 family)